MKARELDRKFDEGEIITESLDLEQARRPAQERRRVNVDFPIWMIHSLDKEARRLGVTRQSIIKVWIAERLGPGSARTKPDISRAHQEGDQNDGRTDIRSHGNCTP